MAGGLINLWPYKKIQKNLRAQKEWVFIIFIWVLTGILMTGFLINLNFKNLEQEKKLIFLNQQEQNIKNKLAEELNYLNQEQKDWAAQGLKLDLLLNDSRESSDWAVFLNNLPSVMPPRLVLENLSFESNRGLTIEGLTSQNAAQDLEIFVANLKKEHLFSQVEIRETQGARFLIQAKADSDA